MSAYEVETLSAIAKYLKGLGQEGYASQLVGIAKSFQMLEQRVKWEQTARFNLAEFYADWTPPPKVYRSAPHDAELTKPRGEM